MELTVRSTTKDAKTGALYIQADDLTAADFEGQPEGPMGPGTPDKAIRLSLTIPGDKAEAFAPPVVGGTLTIA